MKRMDRLSRREREMMEIVFAMGNVTAGEVRERMQAAPSYSAVRATLRILELKGLLRHKDDGRRYVYSPKVAKSEARQNAIEHLLNTFFDGSRAGAVLTLLEQPGTEMSDSDLDRISQLIERARGEGR